jgi:hypothetical protein
MEMKRHLVLISVVLLSASASIAMTQTEQSLRCRLSAQIQRLQLNQEQKTHHINKVNRWFENEVDKLLYVKQPGSYNRLRGFRLKRIENFRWAKLNVNSKAAVPHTFVATGGYITSDGRIIVGGYCRETSEPVVFGSKEFQFKSNANWGLSLTPKELRDIELNLGLLQSKRQAYLNRVEIASQRKIDNVKAALKGIIAAPVKTGPYEIQAICFSDGIASAMIDNKLLYEGDIINGAKITKIEKDSVHFQEQ